MEPYNFITQCLINILENIGKLNAENLEVLPVELKERCELYYKSI